MKTKLNKNKENKKMNIILQKHTDLGLFRVSSNILHYLSFHFLLKSMSTNQISLNDHRSMRNE